MTGNTNKIYQSADRSVIRNSRAAKLNLKAVATPPAARGELNAFANASTDKYYATNSGVPGEQSVAVSTSSETGAGPLAKAILSHVNDESQLSAAVSDIVELLSSGRAGTIHVPVMEDLVSQMRTSLEVRVGNEEITREQYNDVVFDTLARPVKKPEPEVAAIVAEEGPVGDKGPDGERGEPGEPADKEVADNAEGELTALESFLGSDKEETSRGTLFPVSELNPEDLSDLFSGETAVSDDDDDDDDDDE